MLQHWRKSEDSELTENKRMEKAKTPMSARIVAKTSRPSGPPSAIANILRNRTPQQNPTHIRGNAPIRTLPTNPRTQKTSYWTQNPEHQNLNRARNPRTDASRGSSSDSTDVNSPMSWLQTSKRCSDQLWAGVMQECRVPENDRACATYDGAADAPLVRFAPLLWVPFFEGSSALGFPKSWGVLKTRLSQSSSQDPREGTVAACAIGKEEFSPEVPVRTTVSSCTR